MFHNPLISKEIAMEPHLSFNDRLQGALWGMFIGDALAMPVHWYYDTLALVRDYGTVRDYLQPRNPHPDSILWRSSYTPPNPSADILHDQAKYWGKRDIHYHQFLQPGENTLNLKLAHELLIMVADGQYSVNAWLEQMVAFMTEPGRHNDTYVEEYLREFFINRSKGFALEHCGRKDEKHIGGFSQMLPMVLSHADSPEKALETGLQHLALTHGGGAMSAWGKALALLLLELLQGRTMYQAMSSAQLNSSMDINTPRLEALQNFPDNTVVGRHFSSACYIEYALPATFFLALKYENAPEEGLIANTMCGGDNCGRGTVLGALLGARKGMRCWPDRWVNGLLEPPPSVGEGSHLNY